ENVIHLYFGILILKEQKKILEFTQSDVSNNLKKSKIAYDAKAISGYHLNVMNAESIKLDQKITETNSQMKTLILNLGKIIHRDLSERDVFSVPLQIPVNQSINRPEYKLILVQRALLQQQNKLNSSRAIPKVLAFGQAGYSNPALNFLKDEFQTYYIAGLKLNWNISSLYNLKSDNRISKLNGSITELQEEAFLYKLNLEKTQQEVDADKFLILQGQDKQLVFLLSKIKEASKLQYENGSLTLSEYLKDLNAEEQARLNEVIHRISYLKSLYLNNNLYGNQQ
ncbi:MAG: TolC family protein, partial [Saprospiraceae bacterium]|nr:TolC family protein [Saprospiraceae bacterium]